MLWLLLTNRRRTSRLIVVLLYSYIADLLSFILLCQLPYVSLCFVRGFRSALLVVFALFNGIDLLYFEYLLYTTLGRNFPKRTYYIGCVYW
jgi:hypothetical protein